MLEQDVALDLTFEQEFLHMCGYRDARIAYGGTYPKSTGYLPFVLRSILIVMFAGLAIWAMPASAQVACDYTEADIPSGAGAPAFSIPSGKTLCVKNSVSKQVSLSVTGRLLVESGKRLQINGTLLNGGTVEFAASPGGYNPSLPGASASFGLHGTFSCSAGKFIANDAPAGESLSQVGTVQVASPTNAPTFSNGYQPLTAYAPFAGFPTFGSFTISIGLSCPFTGPAPPASPIVATDDSASGINGVIGITTALNVLTGDTINGTAATTGSVTLSVAPGFSVPTQLTFNTATGAVGVNSNTLAGTYSFDYRICEKTIPTNCETASVSITVAPSTDLRITKTNTPGVNGEIDQPSDSVFSGTTVSYRLTVTNNGPDPSVGAVVSDTVGAGLTCLTSNVVLITGSGVPAGSFTIADLTGSGIPLGTLASGQFAQFTYSCAVD